MSSKKFQKNLTVTQLYGKYCPNIHVCTFQTNRVDTRATDRDELDGRRHQDVTPPRSTQRPHRQGGARLHLHYALQRQFQRAG